MDIFYCNQVGSMQIVFLKHKWLGYSDSLENVLLPQPLVFTLYWRYSCKNHNDVVKYVLFDDFKMRKENSNRDGKKQKK